MCTSFAQTSGDIKRTYHWYFGNGAGLDFSSGIPTAITNSPMTAEEGCASISDTCGNLLFYTDGDTVWDRNNNVMPNGTGLFGCWSSTQNSLIVPQPGNDSLYYIFLTDCAENDGANGLRYSVVNINLNGGVGDITAKNILLYAPVMEKLAATYDANGTGVWILSLNKYPIGPPPDTTYQYYAYLLTSTGINLVPVISPSAIHPHKTPDGYLRFSHSGNEIACVHHGYGDTIEVADFNIATGIVSNNFALGSGNDSVPSGGYGLVFSPDDSKLYYSTVVDSSYVIQYDLTSGIPSIINASRTVIRSGDWNYLEFFSLETGSDGKLYVNRWNNNDSLMDVIQSPNMVGLSCNYSPGILNLLVPQIGIGLPNFMDSYLRGTWQPPCNTGSEENDLQNEILIYPNPFNDFTNVVVTNQDHENMTIILFDLAGRRVKQFATSATQFTISRDNLHSGIYFLSISIRNSTYNQKIIITDN